MDITPLSADAGIWHHIFHAVDVADLYLETNLPLLWAAIKGAWKSIVAVVFFIVIFFSNPVRIATLLGSNLAYVFNQLLRRQAMQQLINEDRIIPPPRARNAHEFENTSAERGKFINAIRDVIAGQRIGLEGPYAASLMVEIVFFNQDFLYLRGILKDHLRRWDEKEEAIRKLTLELSHALEKLRAPFKAELAALVEAIDIAETEHTHAYAEMCEKFTIFGYLKLKKPEFKAKRKLKRAQKAYDAKKKEIDKLIAPTIDVYNAHLRPLLIALDAIQRFDLSPVAERFRADWRSIVLTVTVGRTPRKLMEESEGNTIARRVLKLDKLPHTRNEMYAFFRHELKGKIAYSPISPLEEWFEAYLRQHLTEIENIDFSEHFPLASGLEKEWLESLALPASKGIAKAMFPH